MRTGIAERVIELISREAGGRHERIHEEQDFYQDLGIYGDDVDDLFVAFCEEFDFPMERVDVTGCFPGEGWRIFPFPQPLHWSFKPEQRLRVKHLIAAAESMRWPPLEKVGVLSHPRRG